MQRYRCLWRVSRFCHIRWMDDAAFEPVPAGAQTYRLVVRALPSAKRQFVWEVLEDTTHTRVQTSEQTFRSLSDAHTAGQAALGQWRDKVMKTTSKALLTKEAALKHGTKGSTPQFVTSR